MLAHGSCNVGSIVAMSSVPVATVKDPYRLIILYRKIAKEFNEADLIINLEIRYLVSQFFTIGTHLKLWS